MKEEYWEQFMTTGRIADYLSYKAESGSSESRCLEEQKEQAGVRSGESDCFDRMVLSTAPVGEYDRRVVILTKEQGKILHLPEGEKTKQSAGRCSQSVFFRGVYDV